MSARSSLIVALTSVALTACQRHAPVAPAVAAEARAYIEAEVKSPTPLSFSEPWMLSGAADSGMICGEFTGLPLVDRPVRYIYTAGDSRYGTVEMHEFWLTASPMSQAILAANRKLFDDTWSEYCEPVRPGWKWPLLR